MGWSEQVEARIEAPSDLTTLSVEVEGSEIHVFLDRPQARNAFNQTMIDELTVLARHLTTRQDLRCVILRGRGGFFSAGGDLRGLGNVNGLDSASEDEALHMQRSFGTLLNLLDRLPQALLVVVEGAALGGGFGLLMVADVVLARAEARLGMPETRLGLVPAQIAPFVVRRIGLAASRRLLVTGSPIDARRGVTLGLVDHCCEADADLEAALTTTRREVQRCGPQAIADGKALLLAATQGPGQEMIEEGAKVFARRLRSTEAQEGIAAFLAGRDPEWSGEGS